MSDRENPTRIELTAERREAVLNGLRKLYYNAFDEDISDFQAEALMK